MMNSPLPTAMVMGALLVTSWSTQGHVPYLEETDYSIRHPFFDMDVTQSIAVYSWLQSATDADVYVCRVTEPSRLFVEILVPVCPAYDSFFPAFAVMGPGLPAPAVSVGAGYSIQPVPWVDQSLPRKTFYEPFGAKSYYQGPSFDQEVTVPGVYVIICWDPRGQTGDYVLPIGFEERWPPAALRQALRNTPKIRANKELHSPCAD